jgi:hypothetical protein
MKAMIALRVAAVLVLVQGFAHGSIILFGGANRGAEEAQVIATMQAHLFGSGTGRTYWDYYVGYAMFAALTCVLEAVLFWIASGMGKQMRPIALLFLVGNLGYAALVSRFFTLKVPLIFDLIVAVCLGLACFWAEGD